jgi:CRISPR/Cas system CMR subunit Cmr6 (Cas7 group RAMP superfamily)
MKNLGQYLEVTLANEILFSGSTFQPDGQKETVDARKPRRLIVKLVEDFISTNLNPKGPIASQVAQRAERLADLVSATGGLVQPFVATDRSVSGIGNPTPLENGIHLDWATGWPIFPGSGLKGAALAWASMGGHSLEELDVVSWEDFVDLYIAVFGCGPDEDADGAVGGVVWHDAWVLPGVGLPVVFDVMTPHYGDFQQGRGCDAVLPRNVSTTLRQWHLDFRLDFPPLSLVG